MADQDSNLVLLVEPVAAVRAGGGVESESPVRVRVMPKTINVKLRTIFARGKGVMDATTSLSIANRLIRHCASNMAIWITRLIAPR